MAVNVEVKKTPTESATSVIRKFTKRVQGAGILPRVRGLRYFERAASKATSKKKKLLRLRRQDRYQELLKLGKIAEVVPGAPRKK
jgi:ribosomal protein S21